MGGEWRSSTGDSWALDVDEGGAGGASSGPGSEVGAPHRTGTGPAPSLVSRGEGRVSRRGGLIGVSCRSSRPRSTWLARHPNPRITQLDPLLGSGASRSTLDAALMNGISIRAKSMP
jgi:hypothetical protein